MKSDLKGSFRTRNEYMQYVEKEGKTLPNKNELIVNFCKDKKVLDIGCIDHSFETAIKLGDNWLHKKIKNVAKQLIGIDILKKDIDLLNQQGYNIIEANVENFNFGQTFDVIIAGDIIEHVSNIGLFLDSIRSHMDNETVLVITTPNPFNIEQTMLAIFSNRILVNMQHTTWLSPHNFWELSIRHGFKISNFYWINTRFHFRLSRRYFLINKLSNLIMSKRNICKRDFAIILQKENE